MFMFTRPSKSPLAGGAPPDPPDPAELDDPLSVAVLQPIIKVTAISRVKASPALGIAPTKSLVLILILNDISSLLAVVRFGYARIRVAPRLSAVFYDSIL